MSRLLKITAGSICCIMFLFSGMSVAGRNEFAGARTLISFWGTPPNKTMNQEKVINLVKENFPVDSYREVKIKTQYLPNNMPNYILVYLFSNTHHQVQIARIDVNENYRKTKITFPYQLNKSDVEQAIKGAETAKCPDDTIEFIAFAPNDMQLEQDVTIDVAKAAQEHGLKTITLLIKQATVQNYLNYMQCPKLIGNFYDGDANPTLITTNDGVIPYDVLAETLAGKFKYKVTNIWLACEAFNNPILSVMINVVQSQKYAAGINSLWIGPSDATAACTMKFALDGKDMHSAFEACYQLFDIPDDHWGFAGKGSRYFGK